MFKRCGAVVIDADLLARDIVKPDKPAWREILRQFGPSILNADRTVNRQALGRIVFRNPTKRRRLERIIHPRVAREQIRLAKHAARKDPAVVVIYDVPLLFEAGIDKRVDKIVVVTAGRATQIARLRRRNGLSTAEALRRIKSQWPLAEKVARAHYVVDGTVSRNVLLKQIRRLCQELRAVSQKSTFVHSPRSMC
jgi:dephospho-CoA kinase